MMSCSQSDDDEELGDLIYNSSRTAQRFRETAVTEERALFGVVDVQNPPPVSSLREEDSDLEINTRNSIVGQSGFQQTLPQG